MLYLIVVIFVAIYILLVRLVGLIFIQLQQASLNERTVKFCVPLTDYCHKIDIDFSIPHNFNAFKF